MLATTITPIPSPGPDVNGGLVGANVGTTRVIQITAQSPATSYGATGLPPGMSLDPTTGIILGNPTTQGNYYVQVTATNAGGTSTNTMLIAVGPPTGYLPVAQFIRNPASGSSPLTVAFNATSSYASGSIASYDWVFGDGTTGTGPTPSHTFQNVGTYETLLTITDNLGNQGQAYNQTIVINLRPAQLQAASVTGTAGGTVNVDITYTPSPDMGVESMGFDLSLPTGLTFVSGVAGPAAVAAGKSFYQLSSQLALLGFNLNVIPAGVIATLTLSVSPTATGTLPVSITLPSLSGTNPYVNVPATTVSGSVTVTAVLMTPNLSLPATMSVNDSITLDYPSPVPVTLEWTISNQPIENAAAQPAGARTAAVSPMLAMATGSSFSLAQQHLSPGHYWIQVVAVDAAGDRSLRPSRRLIWFI